MRKLASVQKIVDVQPIEGADKICKYKVNNWWVVDGIGKYKVGDLVVYCEIDSFLPIWEEYEFLRKSSYKKLPDGREGFRLKTIRLRGQLSQGLILTNCKLHAEGDDLTDFLGITKYEPPVPACLAGQVKGNFPGFLHKTDEERVQNIKQHDYNSYKAKGNKFYFTEKLDGSSCTMYLRGNDFGVCSRNMDLKETDGNTFWKVARQYNIEEILRKHLEQTGLQTVAVQGELIGEGVQGNRYKITGHQFRIFNLYYPDIDKWGSLEELEMFAYSNKLWLVPILQRNAELPDSIEECLSLAEGKSIFTISRIDNVEREGIVIRHHDRSISFKAISNKFLLKNGD